MLGLFTPGARIQLFTDSMDSSLVRRLPDIEGEVLSVCAIIALPL